MRYLITLLLLLLPSVCFGFGVGTVGSLGSGVVSAPSGPTEIASDTFSSYTHGSNLSASANWTAIVNDFITISASYVRGTTASAFNVVYWSGDSFNSDQYSEVIIRDTSAWAGPAVRLAASQGYGVKVLTSSVQLFSFNGSSDSNLTSYTVSPVLGDKVKIKVSGSGSSTRLTVAYDTGSGYSDVITDYDPGAGKYYDGGSAGMITYGNGATSIDDWAGGNL
jgi:hypothetical protein